MLYTAMTRAASQVIFVGDSATAKRVVPGQPPAMEGLPERLTHIVERCLEPEPENRWQSARDVKAELEWAAKPGQGYSTR